MSGIARILLDRGGLVSGSDAKESRGVVALRARGASIRIGHDASSLDLLPGGPTAVVTTHAAIPKTNPELVEARRRGIPVILRPVVLAKLMAGHTTLMVTGTHGKTTTTSMLIVALQHSGFDPSFAVGGELGEAGTNAHHGSGDCFVAEADESDGSLLRVHARCRGGDQHRGRPPGLLRQRRGLRARCSTTSSSAAPGGALVVCTDDAGRGGTGRARRRTGRPGAGLRKRRRRHADWQARLLNWEQQGTGAVARRPAGRRVAPAGDAACRCPAGTWRSTRSARCWRPSRSARRVDAVLDGLAGFEGVRRRFELVGTANGVRVFDDYAHHPTEVRATLTALRAVAQQGDGRAARIVVFQPHLYSRTKTFAEEFGPALDGADEVFVLDVYAAREQPMAGVSGAIVAEHVSGAGALRAGLLGGGRTGGGRGRPGDVVVTMGAGDVTMLGPEILDGAAGEGQPQRPGRAGTGIPHDRADGRPTKRPKPRPSDARRRRVDRRTRADAEAEPTDYRGAAPAGAAGT